LVRPPTSWGCISTSFKPCGFDPYLMRIMEHCSCQGPYVEADFSSSNINLCSRGTKEWSPKDEGRFLRCLHVQQHKVN
jgi:hypothetical protein